MQPRSTHPLVSILIPAYNAGTWIEQTIRSALAQTWPAREIIIVDDGSTDDTLAIAQRFASDEVTVVSQPNQGAAAARNKAYALSRGDYIQWLDADDLLAPDKIERQMELAQRGTSPRVLLSGAWGTFCYRVHKAKFVPTPLWTDLSTVEWMIRKFEHGVFMQTGTWLVSRQLSDAAGPWDTRLLGDDDGEYFCRVLFQSEGVRFVKEARALYRMPGASTLSYIGHSNRKMEAHFLSMKLHIARLRAAEDSDRVRAACVRYLQCWLPFFHPERPDIVQEAQELAASLGGRLHEPAISPKYLWLKALFGWPAAKRAQLRYNQCKNALLRCGDRIAFAFERNVVVHRPAVASPINISH